MAELRKRGAELKAGMDIFSIPQPPYKVRKPYSPSGPHARQRQRGSASLTGSSLPWRQPRNAAAD